MIQKIHQHCPVITQDGLTFKLSQNQYLIWTPQKDTAFERFSGTLSHAGITKRVFRHWADKRKPHQKDSARYFLVMNVKKPIKHPAYPEYEELFSDQMNNEHVYMFESKETGNIIEQIMYNYTEGDDITVLFKDGKFSIDDGSREKVCELPYWNIQNNGNKVSLYHEHPLTERIFEAPFMKKGKKYVCQGCSRKAPKGVVMQMSLAAGIAESK